MGQCFNELNQSTSLKNAAAPMPMNTIQECEAKLSKLSAAISYNYAAVKACQEALGMF